MQVALLPRYYGYQRTDSIKVTSPNATLRERLTFDQIKKEDISHLSLEVRFELRDNVIELQCDKSQIGKTRYHFSLWFGEAIN